MQAILRRLSGQFSASRGHRVPEAPAGLEWMARVLPMVPSSIRSCGYFGKSDKGFSRVRELWASELEISVMDIVRVRLHVQNLV